MHKLIKLGLNLVQEFGLDEPMIKMSRSKLLKHAVNKYGWHHEGYKHVSELYDYLRAQIERSGRDVSFKDKSILEIGAGNSIGLGYFFFNEGYRSWTASDNSRNPNETARVRKLEYEFAKRIGRECGDDILECVSLEGDRICFRDKLSFRNIDITRYQEELKNKFDVILSIAVLEHLPKKDMGRAIANMAWYLTDGGIMIHIVDLTDHVNPLNPFGFYKYDEEKWDSLTRGSIFYTNRLRAKDYLDFCEKYELSIEYFHRDWNTPLKFAARIDSHFKENYAEEDLQAGGIFFVSTRRHASQPVEQLWSTPARPVGGRLDRIL